MAACLNIIVVEDHQALRMVTVSMLRQLGHHVMGLSCAEDIDEKESDIRVDLFIIDLNLPGEDGISLTRRIRKSFSGVGVIMVTARSLLEDKVLGYESGADIYLTKPVDPAELAAAITSLSRRVKPEQAALGSVLRLDLQSLLLQGELSELKVTHSEAALLAALARAPGQRLEFWQLIEVIGKSADTFSKNSLESRVLRLRKKIAEAAGVVDGIQAIRQYGYQLCVSLHVN